MQKSLGFLAVGVLAVSMAAPAGACSLGWCFGAIAIGPLGKIGAASHERTAPEAAARAQLNCGAGCDQVEVFHSGCAALATDLGRNPHLGFAKGRRAAERRAMKACEATGGRCAVQRWTCSK